MTSLLISDVLVPLDKCLKKENGVGCVVLSAAKDLTPPMLHRTYYVYMICNDFRNVLYIGVTNNLIRRIHEHKEKRSDSFTSKYNIRNLVYYEETQDIFSAIEREKEIKGWKRWKKNVLVNKMNPGWRDLADTLN